MQRKRSRRPVEVGEVEEFQWDDENLVHCANHNFGPRIACQVKNDLPRAFPNNPKRRAPFYMVGRADNGILWTIAIEPTPTAKLWRPITGYPSTASQQEQYHRWIGEPLKKARANAPQK
jgi:hypothetical protein